ncbi:mitoferrin-1 isoform X2 [Amyelois transitella]|uniref:mitoferrin-1 isoform X2 n=1 Tax=Amyelois transitella TaxID=680683 RepID=UPI00299022BD|nr:mitoferrin-1 isoform X2 [Amyelois transitella]
MNFDDYEALPTNQNFTTHMTAGAIAGVMEHCIMYPLDSVKTRMQSLRSLHNRTIGETFRYMVRTEGLLRPIRGMTAVVAGAGPAHACYFATYEHAKQTLSHLTRHRHDHITHGLSGCLASLVHDAVSNPTEVVKQRMQMLDSQYRSVWECARGVYRAEGIRAFYRSYGTQVAMNVPYTALHFVTYEWCQRALNPSRGYSPGAHAAAGAAAAVLRAGGPPAFFRGVSARVLYQMPAAAICWLTYETFKHLLAPTEPRSEEAGAGAGAGGVSGGVAGGVAGGVSGGVSGGVAPQLARAGLAVPLRLAATSAD